MSGTDVPEGSGDEKSPEEPVLTTAEKYGILWVYKGREGMAPKNYRRFLLDLESELGECLREAEDMLWHHEQPGTARRMVYNRICTWLLEINERISWYDNTKAGAGKRTKGTQESGRMVRLDNQRVNGSEHGGCGRSELTDTC